VARAIGKDPTIYDELKTAAQELVDQGVRAVTGDCGFMALHQQRLARDLDVPVFLSSLLQIPFMLSIFGEEEQGWCSHCRRPQPRRRRCWPPWG
jgi:hypothetical protein